jgi:hypothetical protein
MLFGLLMLLSVNLGEAWHTAVAIGLALSAAVFAIIALSVLYRRKRKLVDWTVRFWRLGLAHLLVIAVLIPIYLLSESAPLMGVLGILIGLGFGLGFVISVMMGMLQKIVPFLVYLHLQRRCLSNPAAMPSLPNMKTIISTHQSRQQFYLHSLGLVLLYGAVVIPEMRLVAALILLTDFAWLGYCIWGAARCYTRSLSKIETTPAAALSANHH